MESKPPPTASDPRSAEEQSPPTAAQAPPSSTGAQSAQTKGGGLAESRAWLGDQRLVRPREGRMVAGVCVGLARRYGMPVFLVRVLAVAAGIAGFGLILYAALWILMPNER
jgi:phage shock protein C